MKSLLKILVLIFLASCSILGNTENKLIEEKQNPDKSFKAIVFEKYAGATADNSMHIFLGTPTYTLKNEDEGNVFTANSNHSKTVLNDRSVLIEWHGADTLFVSYDRNLATFVKKEKLGKAIIVYHSF